MIIEVGREYRLAIQNSEIKYGYYKKQPYFNASNICSILYTTYLPPENLYGTKKFHRIFLVLIFY